MQNTTITRVNVAHNREHKIHTIYQVQTFKVHNKEHNSMQGIDIKHTTESINIYIYIYIYIYIHTYIYIYIYIYIAMWERSTSFCNSQALKCSASHQRHGVWELGRTSGFPSRPTGCT